MQLQNKLHQYNQRHILHFWDELTDNEKEQLENDLREIDWEQLEDLRKSCVLAKQESSNLSNIEPAKFFPLNPKNENERNDYNTAQLTGDRLIRDGRVAAFTVAGGQSTRLGFDSPKGTFPISPIKGKSLFQLFAESILRYGEIYETQLRWYVMTSPATDEKTKLFFQEHQNFGLQSDQIFFLTQGSMPIFDFEGKLLLDEKYRLAKSPDGHGGCLIALKKSGALDDMKARGIDYITYFQIDNPLVTIFDPLFIGLHTNTKSEMSSRCIVKTDPNEKTGIFCDVDGKTRIVEYSELSEDQARQPGENGGLRFNAGSPAIHILNREFAERLNEGRFKLPFHRAEKKVSYIDTQGEKIKPVVPNAIKLEAFIFDALPLTTRTIILEAFREREFAPVKNATGIDSPESSQLLLQKEFSRWLVNRNIPLPQSTSAEALDFQIEISPRSYVNEADFQRADLSDIMIKTSSQVYLE